MCFISHFSTIPQPMLSVPGGMVVKNPSANAEDTGDMGSIPESERSPGEGKRQLTPVFWPGDFPLQADSLTTREAHNRYLHAKMKTAGVVSCCLFPFLVLIKTLCSS